MNGVGSFSPYSWPEVVEVVFREVDIWKLGDRLGLTEQLPGWNAVGSYFHTPVSFRSHKKVLPLCRLPSLINVIPVSRTG